MSGAPTSEGVPRPEDLDVALRRARQIARSEISDALHDGVVQSMTALMMRLAVGCIDAPPAVRTALEGVEMDMSHVVTELRDLVNLLRLPGGDADDPRPRRQRSQPESTA